MSIEVIELAMKCRVPRSEAEDHIIRLRRGEEQLPLAESLGLKCKDAFDTYETMDPETAVLRVGYW
jgi:hypothetical protein